MSRVTLEDAIAALHRIEVPPTQAAAHGIINEFLTRLASFQEESVYETDRDAYIVEGACQKGFDFIDDDGDLLIVSTNKLQAFVKLYRDHKPS